MHIHEIRADWYATTAGAHWETYRIGLPMQIAGKMKTPMFIDLVIDPFHRFYRITFDDETVIEKVNVSHVEYRQ